MALLALLIDDDPFSLEVLSDLLKEDSELRIAGTASNTTEAREFLQKNPVDVIFLDVEMPEEDGFAFLQSARESDYEVVLISAHEQYALTAFNTRALYFLLKPFERDTLKEALIKIREKISRRNLERTESSTFTQHKERPRLSLPHTKGFQLVKQEDIIYLEADGNYTTLYLSEGEKLVVSKSLKDFEEALDYGIFARVHRSNIINLLHLEAYTQDDGGFAMMSGKHKVAVARRKIQDFLERVDAISHRL
jgi:two-component system LytT family response regulator